MVIKWWGLSAAAVTWSQGTTRGPLKMKVKPMVRCVAHTMSPSRSLHLWGSISVHTSTNTARNTQRLVLTTPTKAQCSAASCSSSQETRATTTTTTYIRGCCTNISFHCHIAS